MVLFVKYDGQSQRGDTVSAYLSHVQSIVRRLMGTKAWSGCPELGGRQSNSIRQRVPSSGNNFVEGNNDGVDTKDKCDDSWYRARRDARDRYASTLCVQSIDQ